MRELPDLLVELALSPLIAAETLDFQRCNHHKAHANNRNDLLPRSEIAQFLQEYINRMVVTVNSTNASQVSNQILYWKVSAQSELLNRPLHRVRQLKSAWT